MITQIQAGWAARTPAQRAAIVVSLAAAAALLYLALVQWAGDARARLRTSVTALQAQAEQLAQHAREIETLRSRPAPAVSRASLRTLVQAQAETAGLAHAVLRLDAPDADRVTIALGAVAFADWTAWLTGLRTHHVGVESCRVEALSGPGLVSVSATLTRASGQ